MNGKYKPLSDEQFKEVLSLMNWSPPLQRGTPRASIRAVWNSIFYILLNGCRWADIPKTSEYAHRATAHRWLKKWREMGVFDRVLNGLLLKANNAGKIDLSTIIVDGTFSPSTGRRREC